MKSMWPLASSSFSKCSGVIDRSAGEERSTVDEFG